LLGLGAKVEEREAPFEPESGAYGGGHAHHEEGGHGGRIHQYEKDD
jgi:urease accessory protein